MKKMCAALAALTLAACAGEPKTEYVTIAAAPDAPPIPAECLSADPAWQSLPPRDVKQSELARNYAANKRVYQTVRGKRNVCRAGLTAARRG